MRLKGQSTCVPLDTVMCAPLSSQSEFTGFGGIISWGLHASLESVLTYRQALLPFLPPWRLANKIWGPEASITADACDLGSQKQGQEGEFEFSLGYSVNFGSTEATWGDSVNRQTDR